MNFYEDIKIDKYNLVEENIRHSTLVMQYHEKLSEAIRKKDDLKLEMEVLEAEIDREVRDKKHKLLDKDVKITEALVKVIVSSDDRRIKLQKKINKAVEDVNIYRGATEAFSHRRNNLDNVTSLFQKGFFSEPNGKNEAVREKVDEERGELRKKLKENKRLK